MVHFTVHKSETTMVMIMASALKSAITHSEHEENLPHCPDRWLFCERCCLKPDTEVSCGQWRERELAELQMWDVLKEIYDHDHVVLMLPLD
ncbi:hypothetical protein CDAR_239741 [Caerostris darwini]|uniref:Uncharacterized protein n=1 Tax=Caerostris darwini TaxID=1538125 RepID=A0AAV4QYL8_9ARAC|nr:hypothetical protein CDAR_239741 [Caerostris darwini]